MAVANYMTGLEVVSVENRSADFVADYAVPGVDYKAYELCHWVGKTSVVLNRNIRLAGCYVENSQS